MSNVLPAAVTHLVFTAALPPGERFRVVPGTRVVFVNSSTRRSKPWASSPHPIGLLPCGYGDAARRPTSAPLRRR